MAMEAPAAVATPAPPRQSMSMIAATLMSREAPKLTAYCDTKSI
ncbi:hypothetical protein J2X65_004511 [Ancylobacter sp. 3268]|nr:hypothetical protein [Ancylobacter sp. 3268]MDR6955132.1 hypothetical protein [Ancylobacter sp. 3268]